MEIEKKKNIKERLDDIFNKTISECAYYKASFEIRKMRGFWESGIEIIKEYDINIESVRQDNKEISNNNGEIVSISEIKRDTGRNWHTIKNWISKVKEIGIDEIDFKNWEEKENNKIKTRFEAGQQDNKNREAISNKTITPDIPNKKYRIIYADPPWQYNADFMKMYGHVGTHYKPKSIEELCDLKDNKGVSVKNLFDDNCVLFLWVTSPKIPEAIFLISSWGFEYKTSFIWDKIKHNMGHYNSVRHELLFIAGRGSSTPDKKKLYDSVVSIERSEKHSEKPEYFREIIDDLYVDGNRIELFARRKDIKNWDFWGAEIND